MTSPNTKPTKRGGKRQGAGRKPTPPRVAVTVRIAPKAADKLNAYVEAKQPTLRFYGLGWT